MPETTVHIAPTVDVQRLADALNAAQLLDIKFHLVPNPHLNQDPSSGRYAPTSLVVPPADADPRLAEIRAREQAAARGPWIADGAELFQGEGDIPAFWGTWIGETLNIDDDAASNANAQFVAHARTDIPWLVAELTEARTKLEIAERRNGELAERLAKYEGHEPTVDEEMAYLNRCLNAVQDVCDKAESTATRWEQPLPVPEWVTVVRAAATGSVTEEEPAGVPW